MNEPLFLTLNEVLQLHGYQIEHFGGDPAIRDLELLESAVHQPLARYDGRFLHPDLASMAAAYLFHIVQNHAFADGNKRTGAHAAIAFLAMNNIDVDYPTDEMEALTVGIAAGKAKEDAAVEFFRKLLGQQPGDAPQE